MLLDFGMFAALCALAEASEGRALGLRYFHIPMPVWGRPTDEQVRRVMEIINPEENGRVFIHCKDGVDRTGTIVAIHRNTNDDWSASDATAEAMRYGMRRINTGCAITLTIITIGNSVRLRSHLQLHRRLTDATLKAESARAGGECEVFRTQWRAGRRLRSTPGEVSGFFGKVF